MLKFIHADFEIDLSNYEVNRVEENQWFSDQFFTKYTFPFELPLTDELNRALGLISHYNISDARTFFRGHLFVEGRHEEATLEILDAYGKSIQVEISYGFEQLPNWETKLSELPLQKAALSESLFLHAVPIISQTWPDVNYNFPQVHTDSFDAESDDWNGFEGIINNYQGGAFLENEFDSNDNTIYNRNIMIPMPYLLHVLTVGFENAGYTLSGDVLQDTELQQMLLFRESEEYINARIEGEEIVKDINEYDSIVIKSYRYWKGLNRRTQHSEVGLYEFEHYFPERGKYKIAGNVYMKRDRSDAIASIHYNGVRVYHKYKDFIRQDGDSAEGIHGIDLDIDVEDTAVPLIITNEQIVYRYENDIELKEGPLWDLTVTPLAIYDSNGHYIPAVVTTEKLDLAKCVPDKTFGELVTLVKNWKNLDLKIVGKEVFMDYIEPQMDIRDALNLEAFNQKEPRRKFKQGDSYLLQLQNLDHESYTRSQLFFNIEGIQTSGFTKTDKTQEILIDAIPLPLTFRNDVATAFAVDNGESSFAVVLYNGLSSGANITLAPGPILCPAIYENHWSRWLDFRLRSQSFVSRFNVPKLRVQNLRVSDKVFMYNNFHIIKVISKTNIAGKPLYDLELELELLK